MELFISLTIGPTDTVEAVNFSSPDAEKAVNVDEINGQQELVAYARLVSANWEGPLSSVPTLACVDGGIWTVMKKSVVFHRTVFSG